MPMSATPKKTTMHADTTPSPVTPWLTKSATVAAASASVSTSPMNTGMRTQYTGKRGEGTAPRLVASSLTVSSPKAKPPTWAK
jgi:hypothetical protein